MDQIGRIFGVDDLGVAFDAVDQVREGWLHQQHRVSQLAVNSRAQGQANQIVVAEVAQICVEGLAWAQADQIALAACGRQDDQFPGQGCGVVSGNPRNRFLAAAMNRNCVAAWGIGHEIASVAD